MPKPMSLIPKFPKYKRFGLSEVLDQGKKSFHQLFNPEGKRRVKKSKSKSMKL